MRAPIAIFRTDLACDFRAGGIADDAACDESDRTENDRAGKAAEGRIGHAFMCARYGWQQEKAGRNNDTACKSFHEFVPRVVPFNADLPGNFITLFPIRILTRTRFDEAGTTAVGLNHFGFAQKMCSPAIIESAFAFARLSTEPLQAKPKCKSLVRSHDGRTVHQLIDASALFLEFGKIGAI